MSNVESDAAGGMWRVSGVDPLTTAARAVRLFRARWLRDLGYVYARNFTTLIVVWTFAWGYLDTALTLIGVSIGGIQLEANAVPAALLHIHPALFAIAKPAAITAVAALALRHREGFTRHGWIGWLIVAMILAGIAVAAINLLAIAILAGYTPPIPA